MMPFQDERDSAEVRLMRSIVELNYRILRTPSASERTALRTSITVLRAELVKLFSNAQVKELDGGRMTHEVNGEYISYDNRKEIAAVRNDVSGQTKPGKGQGVMILAPSRGAAPAPAAGK